MPTAWLLHSGELDLAALAGIGAAPYAAASAAAAAIDWAAPANVPAYSQV